MKKISLAENGSLISPIVAGVMKWGKWGAALDVTQMANLISGSVELGVTTFDHADIYGGYTTEEEFGNAFIETRIPRESVQLITKCGIKYRCDQRPNYKIKSYDHSAAHIKNSVENSLKNLNTDYIDLLLIHRPGPLMDPVEIAECIHELKQSGKIHFFGVSNFTPSQMSLFRREIEISTNQIEVSLKHLNPFTDGTLDYCFEHKIRPMAWSPLGGGKWMSENAAKFSEIANELNTTLDILCYAFLLHHPARIIPVIGTSKLDRIRLAIKALELKLSDEQWYELYTYSSGENLP